jgi:hypothetical protein
MSRLQRLTLTATGLASAVLGLLVLQSAGSTSRGPIGTSLDWLGSTVTSLEHGAREWLSGPGRRAELAWFDAYRTDPARLRHPDRVLLGAYDSGLPGSLDGFGMLERALGLTVPLVQVYVAWGDAAHQRFPLALLTTIWNMGSIPVVTWEPWLTDFDSRLHPHLPLAVDRDRHGLSAVAAGAYDFHIDAWAAAAARAGRPMLLRFAHEMNDPYRYPWGPQHNTKEEYIAAWRHVRARFEQAGADNVLWVWSPHVAYEYWDLYYPGDAHVDWVATGVLNFGPTARWSQWWTFDEIFGSKYARLAAFGKPVMIAELGSLAVGGDRTQWYREALEDLPARYPAVRSVLFFHAADDRTVTYQSLDWTLTGEAEPAAAIRQALAAWPRPE